MILEGRVTGDKKLEDEIAEEVREGEFMMCNECFCRWKERVKERRWRGEVSYSP